MRNMSFMLTTDQIRNGAKTVTRRIGWWFLKPGDRLMACVKCQGLGKGGKIEKIREIEVVSVRRERLDSVTFNDVGREGFPDMGPSAFVDMFRLHMNCDYKTIVNRIEFKYVADPAKAGSP